jgi:tetratricopeptide (TPR) repeat protein
MRYPVLPLLTLSFLLGIVSCSQNPAIEARYQAEKMLFKADRLARSTPIAPDMSNTPQFEQVDNSFSEVTEFCYRSLNALDCNRYPKECDELAVIAFKASEGLTRLLFTVEQYDSCVAVYRRLLEETTLSGTPLIQTWLDLGKSFQAGGKWDSATAVFDYATDNFYPPLGSDSGIMIDLFNLPVRIFDIYSRVGDGSDASEQFDRSQAYYRGLIEKYPDTWLATASHANLAELYRKAGRAGQAVDEWQLVVDSSGAVTDSAREKIADLYARDLKYYDRAVAIYDSLIASISGADTTELPGLEFKRGMAYFEKKEYSEARKILNQLKDKYPDFYRDTPEVQYTIARIFDRQDRWERAETEYLFLLENHEASEEAFYVYIYLADRLNAKGRRLEAQRLKEEAEALYKRVTEERAGTLAEANALTYRAELHRRGRNWEQAAATLGEIFRKFPVRDLGHRSALAAAAIYREKLDDPRRADSLVAEVKKRLTAVDGEAEF